MDRTFFASVEARRTETAKRLNVEAVDAEVYFHGGRVFTCGSVVEASDTWVQLDGRDRSGDDSEISIVVPYHQIASVVFSRRRERHAGF